MFSYFFQSIFLHIFGIVVIWWANYFFLQQQRIEFKRNLRVVRSAIRVDVVAMPRLTLQELKSEEKISPPISKGEENKKKILEVKEEKKTADKKERIKDEKNLDKILKEFSNKKFDDKEQHKNSPNTKLNKDIKEKADDLKRLIVVGNKISQGRRLDKTTDEEQNNLEDNELLNYSEMLVEKVRSYWQLPSHLMDRTLKCRIQIMISRDGEILELVLLEGSGVDEYDQKALQTIKSAGPFPPPPEIIRDQLRNGRLVLGFPI
ncbi:MAG: cell envelope integrity protein TolA [Oligoflexia bacterium]|nr:cell envelope integrity protein TolA [Oligoflexia bacterium]